MDFVQRRYERDPIFHALVDQLEFLIQRADMSGTEIREAAMLALIHYESKRGPRPMILTVEEARNMGIQINH